jgi:hypothetical protein
MPGSADLRFGDGALVSRTRRLPEHFVFSLETTREKLVKVC